MINEQIKEYSVKQGLDADEINLLLDKKTSSESK
jgi:hypothetical protein